MKQAFPSLTEDTHNRLKNQGFEPIKTKPLSKWINPFSDTCKKLF